ncbi:hypothetical protein P7K49_030638 [Saguinus oedipus]|uniref:Solute carrier family 41 member n=1 Tax=Saguinus oedipus TaxID=9490 RepID=A0ABQ9U2R2_SAGOE|nr:hypothetical protein P7K49_030638 [Saguinus oedipus]
MVLCLAMVVTQLNLKFCFQGKKLQGFSCELTRSSHGVLPESFFTIMCQVVVPILLSSLGMMMAGLVINTIQHWPVFVEVKDLLMLVPPLVGLKGNLEMTLASRLSTAVSGHLDIRGSHNMGQECPYHWVYPGVQAPNTLAFHYQTG